jgi:hypothetical protein
MIDYSKLQMSSAASSNKVLLEGNGTFVVPNLPGPGSVFGSASIPHTFGSDKLLYQVTTNSTITVGAILPWQSNDGRILHYAQISSTELTIFAISSSVGAAIPSYSIDYTYRILVP